MYLQGESTSFEAPLLSLYPTIRHDVLLLTVKTITKLEGEGMQHKLDYMVPIRFVLLTWIPLFAIWWLGGQPIWLIGLLSLWIFLFLVSSFSSAFEDYLSLGAFTTLTSLWFAGVLWLGDYVWLRFVFFALIFLHCRSMYKRINGVDKTGVPHN